MQTAKVATVPGVLSKDVKENILSAIQDVISDLGCGNARGV